MSRREFLAAANAAAFLLLVESCSLGPLARSASSPKVPAGGTPQEQALRLLLEAVRSSPDHLALRAEDAVAAKDATRIVEFVRDHVAVLPALEPGDDVKYARRWGGAAALRGGAGTLRERADILADLLTRAGFKATVKAAPRPAAIGMADLYRARVTDFQADASKVALAESLLGQARVATPAAPRAYQPAADPLPAIQAALPAGLQVGRVRDDLLPDQVPVVSFADGGKTRYAFALGGLGIDDAAPAGLHDAGPSDALRSVTLTVSAVASPSLGSSTPAGKLVELVKGTWTADQVVGRQVLLMFEPVQGPVTLLGSSLASLPVRVPMLLVQDGAPTDSPQRQLVASGPAVTVQGDVLAPATGAPDGSLAGPYGTIATLSDSDRRSLAARAATIRVQANASAFPEVALQVALADGGGSPVDGLDAKAFSVSESGKAVDFTLYASQAVQRRPRVMLVYDAAFVDMWPSAAAKSTFESAISQALAAQAAKTPFDVQVVNIGDSPDPKAWAAPQAGAIQAALANAHESADDPWRTLGGAALDQGVVAAIAVTDMDPADVDPTQAQTLQRRLTGSGMPVLFFPVGQVNETTASQVVAASGGTRFDPRDPATPVKIASALAPLLAGWTGGGYRIRYQAPATGAAQRPVTVSLAQGTAPHGSSQYTVPDKPLPPPSFAGLYLTLTFGGLNSFRRLAGVQATPTGTILGPLDDPAAIAEVRAAMDGITTVAIEPGTPTQAAILDDAITSQLSIEPVRALGQATPSQIVKATSGGVRRTPLAMAFLLLARPQAPVALQGTRTLILQERASGASTVEAHADFAIGANEVIPLASDRHLAFTSAMSTSVAASEAEAMTLADTAFSRLEGRPLRSLATGDYAAINDFLGSVPAGRAAAWRAMLRFYGDYHAVVPVAGQVDAMWVVDPSSGATKAVLLDGTGGGILTSGCHLSAEDGFALALAALAIVCSFAPKGLSYYCVGVNVASTGMCVIQLFDGSADMGTPFSIWVGLADPFGPNKGWGAGFGVALILLTLASNGCIDLS